MFNGIKVVCLYPGKRLKLEGITCNEGSVIECPACTELSKPLNVLIHSTLCSTPLHLKRVQPLKQLQLPDSNLCMNPGSLTVPTVKNSPKTVEIESSKEKKALTQSCCINTTAYKRASCKLTAFVASWCVASRGSFDLLFSCHETQHELPG